MHKILAVATLSLAVMGSGAHAAPEGAKPGEARAAQPTRMKACNADAKAKGLKGDERKAFMGDCLKKKA